MFLKKGDIIKFHSQYKGFLKKKKIPKHILSNNNVEYLLKDGDIFEIIDSFLGHIIIIIPLSPNIPNLIFYSFYDKNRYKIMSKNSIIKFKRNIRKMKLENI